MGSSTLLLVITTALITWVISTFVIHLSMHRITTRLDPLTHSRGRLGKSAISKTQNEHHRDIAPMQGGNRPFQKKITSYVNMTDYHGISTTWGPYIHRFPCVPGEKVHMLTTPSHEGLLFQRPVKTGSTSLTGIVLRLAHRYTSALPPNAPSKNCKYRAMHAPSVDLDFANRKRDKSFLLSVVRDPTVKAISRYFHFDVAIGQKVPTDQHFKSIMRRSYNQDDLTQQLMTRPQIPWIKVEKNATQIVQDILDDYDFIAVTERMDESLVVWKILFNLDFYDILYIRARSSGSFSNGVKARPCVYLVPSFLTPGMQDFFNSQEWKDSNAIDNLLYQAVYKSLDNTINSLGVKRIKKHLSVFQKALKIAADFCEGKVHGPCTSGGTPVPEQMRTCVVWSEGCDFQCLESFRAASGLDALLQAEQVG